MAGQMSFGKDYNNAGAGRFPEGRAYADGVLYRARGTSANFPKVRNPHLSNSEEFVAWDNGWDLAEANIGVGGIPANLLGSLAPTGTILV